MMRWDAQKWSTSKWRDERGSAFLLVVFMILMFALLGVAVLGASIGGAQRSQRSEDNVQTVHLADKALSEALAYVMANFDKQSIDPNSLTTRMENFVEGFNNSGGFHNSGGDSEIDPAKNPGYEIKQLCLLGTPSNLLKRGLYCADNVSSESTPAASETSFTNKLRITAEAVVNGMKRDLTQIVTLDTFPDFLRFAMGSEGDVIINGASLLKGSLYAGEELKLQNFADYSYHSMSNAAPTQFFYLKPADDGESASDANEDESGDELGSGKVYVKTYGKIVYRTADNGEYGQLLTGTPNPMFHGLNEGTVSLTETKKFISIDVAQSFVDKAYAALGPTANSSFRDGLWQAYANGGVNSESALMGMIKNDLSVFYSDFANRYIQRVPTAPTDPGTSASDEEQAQYASDKQKYDADMAALNTKLSHLSGPVFVDGDLTIGKELQSIYYTASEKGSADWLIVNGNLTVQNDSPDVEIPVRANILVGGKVNVVGKVGMDATIFSLDGVQPNEFADAQIRGLMVNGLKRGLVLIANGPISIYRVDSFQPLNGGYDKASVSTLDAFFYTDKEAELYGVGSLFWIHGGFFAKKSITINAVLGNTTETSGSDALNFADQNGLNEQQARFVIDYNKDVFNSQYAGLPRVSVIKVIMGQKKLVSAE